MSDMKGLETLGAAGTFISLMATAIVALASAVGIQWRQANKVYGYRLTERDTLKDALNGNTKAMADQTEAAKERNRVIEDLAEAVEKLAVAFDRMNDRLVYQYEQTRDQRRDEVQVISEMAQAVRTQTAMLTDVRNRLLYPQGGPLP